jgi:hypothetical protein
MKKITKLTEQDLHRIVKESVNNILNKDEYISGGGQKYTVDRNNTEQVEMPQYLLDKIMVLCNICKWDSDETVANLAEEIIGLVCIKTQSSSFRKSNQ